MFGITEKLTRTLILEYINQEEIFSKFLSKGNRVVTEIEISNCTESNLLMCSPLRTDNNPTCGFYWRNGRLKMNDFAGYFHGDCFDVVGYQNLLSASNPVDFNIILEIIAKEFKLLNYINETSENYTNKPKNIKEKSVSVFDITPRNWVIKDTDYWKQYYITDLEELQNAYLVYPVYYLYINKQLVYDYNDKDPAYAYWLGMQDNVSLWKIYFPLRKSRFRFLTNTNALQGTHLIKPAKLGRVTKAYKDVVVLHKHFNRQSIGLCAEGIPLTSTQHFSLATNWKEIKSLLDFEYIGIKTSNFMRKRYGIQPNFLTNGILNTINYEAKDISDYLAKFGLEQTHELLELMDEYPESKNDLIDFITVNHSQ
jgi:hypothetical protein